MSWLFSLFLLAAGIFVYICRSRRETSKELTLGFFHPYCDSGGGGERVLWQAVQALNASYPKVRCVIYTGDKKHDKDILSRAVERFNLKPFDARKIRFVYLPSRWIVEDRYYPRFTLLLQSLASAVLAFQALWKFTPNVFFDTTGYAFSFPVARLLFGCSVGCYVHYPTISTDMLQRVQQQRPSYNNSSTISSSVTLSKGKILYYKLFSLLYGLCGKFASVVMVNSSWTKGHVSEIWGLNGSDRLHLVFPPCDTSSLRKISLQSPREDLVISVSQFRPEKDHDLQLSAFAAFLKESKSKTAKLAMIGGVRGPEDQARVDRLKERIKELKIENRVKLVVNAPFDQLQKYLATALVGLHTMWNEHFGIGVVEFQAAGVVPLAHNSGGPKADIVVERQGIPTGFLASSCDEYAQALVKIFSLKGTKELETMRQRARERAQEFSDENFQKLFVEAISPLLKSK